ncbi:PREDICTED: uncharacterized protein LOC105363185 [Ceratosolen solmsi marchali]|uniref:Uncharacterized protein LOC105363185 n=1 Tax=Ceratosolen solmsi marchali TaxID=326594 RepID=A0AAJ6YJB1_9HYME|nr:PREDICTED: uncharacterized protein LOC105363185 [Ceratosolen solmsi marchali]
MSKASQPVSLVLGVYLSISREKMLRYAIYLSLVCAMFLKIIEASPAESDRRSRSIWPFSSTELRAEDLISEENKLILKKAGLEKSLDLSGHPLWKVHKYEGVDVKPVHIETQVIKSDSSIQEPSITAPVVKAVSSTSTSAPIDLSFLDDLGGLASLLPDPKPDEDKISDFIADTIKKEEENHPGFFKHLWWKIWGAPADKVNDIKDKTSGLISSLFSVGQKAVSRDKEDEVLTIYLPETQGSYAAVFLPARSQDIKQQALLFPSKEPVAQLPQKVEPRVPALPLNHANELTQPLAERPRLEATKPVARPVAANSEFSRSEAWIQSWTPHAAYSVHVQGPAGPTTPQPLAEDPLDQYQRKVSQLDPEHQEKTQVELEEEPRKKEKVGGTADDPKGKEVAATEVQVQEEPKKEVTTERGRELIRGLKIPDALLKKFQVNSKDVQAILNDKESATKASERLRTLQREFEMRKDQLSYAFASPKKRKEE